MTQNFEASRIRTWFFLQDKTFSTFLSNSNRFYPSNKQIPISICKRSVVVIIFFFSLDHFHNYIVFLSLSTRVGIRRTFFLSKTVGFENQSIQKRLDTNRDLTWSPIKLFYWWPYDSRVMATRTVPRDSDKKSREVTEKHVKYILGARRQGHVQRDNDSVVVVRHVCRVSDVFLL